MSRHKPNLYIICLFLPALLMMWAISGCQRDNKPVPRREAYPRIEIDAPIYTSISQAPLTFETNANAIVNVKEQNDKNTWIDVTYQSLNATAYFTITKVDEQEMEDVMRNRIERIRLNFGNAYSIVEDIDIANDCSAFVFSAQSGTATPLQFLANQPGYVISGAVFMQDAAKAPADSIAPVIAALKSDIEHAMLTLHL